MGDGFTSWLSPRCDLKSNPSLSQPQLRLEMI